MEPVIRDLANSLIDDFIEEGRCDLMTQYANEVTLRAIVTMVGLPIDDIHLFHKWSRDVVSVISPAGPTADGSPRPTKPMSEEERLDRYGRIAEARRYFGRLIDERTAEPRDDLLSALVAVRTPDGAPAFDRQRIISHMGELLTAGSITTANLVGQMVRLLARHPEQLAALRDDPLLWENAVEEGLRHSGSTLGVYRLLQNEVEIRGVTIPAGSLVWLCYASTGRDEEKFPDPDRFDITRENAAEHLEFGLGPHFCMGAPLARLEARITLQTLYERVPEPRIPPQNFEYNPALVTTSLRHLLVTWDVPAASK
jgi:cytochrome P450